MGAIGEGGVRIINPHVVRLARVSAEELAAVEAREQALLTQRAGLLRGDRPAVALAGRTALIVDDGMATGSTARAACQVARARGAIRVILAVPVAAADVVDALRADADDVICVLTPTWLSSIGEWYDEFYPTTDQEVRDLLARAAGPQPETPRPRPGRDEEVLVRAGALDLPGHVTLPENAPGIVVFVHGSGSSRHSPRNRFVAAVLNEAGLGTLLFDLLTPEEEADRANVFDIELLAGRLTQVTAWLRDQPWARDAPHRLVRRQHRRGSRAVGGRRTRRRRRRHRLPWRPPRPRRAAPRRRAGTDVAHRRRPGPGRPRPQPCGTGPTAMPHRTRGHPRRNTPLRRARHPRRSGQRRPATGSAGTCDRWLAGASDLRVCGAERP